VSKPIYLVHADEYKNWIFDPTHPTQGRRFTNARDLLISMAKSQATEIIEVLPRLATKTELERVHSPAYIEQVLEEHTCDEWDGSRPDMSHLAVLFVGGTLTALEALITKKTNLAINFPGAKHHAQFDHASGFCIFNDFALAADIATKDYGLKVAIIDIDAHHGDGVENLTLENLNVLTFSIHEQGIFPGTGNSDEPENSVFNFPLSSATTGLGDSALIAGINKFIPIAHDFQPDLLFITSGADGLAEDPLTNLRYTVEGYASAARLLAKAFPDTPKLMGGAGGYLPDTGTPEVWAAVAGELSR
jgi:acetoin utilization protein AcuC